MKYHYVKTSNHEKFITAFNAVEKSAAREGGAGYFADRRACHG